MDNTLLREEVAPIPWKGVTVSEQRELFIEDYRLNYYSITELAERFCISSKTAHKWINRYKEHGQSGFHEHYRRPHSCPWQTDAAIVEELVALRKRHPSWGPRKLLDLMHRRTPIVSFQRYRRRPGSWRERGWCDPGGAIDVLIPDVPKASLRVPTTSWRRTSSG